MTTSSPSAPQIVMVPPDAPESAGGYLPHGAAATLWRARDQEVMISGPYETGKSLAMLHKVNAVACKYAGARILLARKTYRSLVQSGCVTFERSVLAKPIGHPECPIRRMGGSSPSAYLYPNGSQIVLGGLDNPDKLLSSEWDIVAVMQAEELSLSDWEALSGRCTGRAGNVPYGQIIGDCNPADPNHWILKRSGLRLIESRHEDNPTLYDPRTGKITERGLRTIAVLDSLTGVRLQRGRYGKWVAAEGQVYEAFDNAVNLVDRFDVPRDWRRVWSIDFGYSNPFVWQEWVLDHDDNMTLSRELYTTRMLVEDAAREIVALTKGDPEPVAIVCDHDAEDRATFERHSGLSTVPAYKSISPGIQAVAARLPRAANGKPRLTIMRDAGVRIDELLRSQRRPMSTLEEFTVYVWPKASDGRALKETPVKEHDHGMDAMRYAVAWVDGIADTRGRGILFDESEEFQRGGRPLITPSGLEW